VPVSVAQLRDCADSSRRPVVGLLVERRNELSPLLYQHIIDRSHRILVTVRFLSPEQRNVRHSGGEGGGRQAFGDREKRGLNIRNTPDMSLASFKLTGGDNPPH
jgi:hypothetical protein